MYGLACIGSMGSIEGLLRCMYGLYGLCGLCESFKLLGVLTVDWEGEDLGS